MGFCYTPLLVLAGLIQPGAVVQQDHARRLIQPAVGIDAEVGGSAHGLFSRPLVLGRIQPNGLRHNVAYEEAGACSSPLGLIQPKAEVA